jgi:hypothetical protein
MKEMTSEEQTSKRKAFWVDKTGPHADGTFDVNFSVEGEPGYYPWNDGWPNFEAAQAEADAMNAQQGLTKGDMEEIVMSSRAAQEEERKRQYLERLSKAMEPRLGDDEPIFTRNDMKRIGSALIQLPYTADIEFPDGYPPLQPTPGVLVDMLEQLREILMEVMAEKYAE